MEQKKKRGPKPIVYTEPVASLLLHNFPVAVRNAVKVKAYSRGITLREFVIEALKTASSQPLGY